MSGLQPKEAYLGDGLYVREEEGSFVLRAPRTDGDHFVVLEPETLANFEAFVRLHRTVLGEADSAKFVAAIENPPEPNSALREAAARYKDYQP